MLVDDGDLALAIVLKDGAVEEELAVRLLRAFRCGYPPMKLEALLGHSSDQCVELGVWIASELGVAAVQLLDTIETLLQHKSAKIRLLAIDCIQIVAGCENGELMSKISCLVTDSDHKIRCKAMNILVAADISTLQIIAKSLRLSRVDDRLVSTIEFLVSNDNTSIQMIVRCLQSSLSITRIGGAIAAARIAPTTLVPLQTAARSSDITIRRFAKSKLYGYEI